MNKTDTKNQLSPKQITFIKAYTTETNLDQVYKRAGVSKGCYYSWLKNSPLFREALAEASNNAIKGITDRLNSLGYLAINALEAELKNNNGQNRIRSAQLILDFLVKFSTINIEARLNELEKIVDEQGGKRHGYN